MVLVLKLLRIIIASDLHCLRLHFLGLASPSNSILTENPKYAKNSKIAKVHQMRKMLVCENFCEFNC